jgi:hypothetical protein
VIFSSTNPLQAQHATTRSFFSVCTSLENSSLSPYPTATNVPYSSTHSGRTRFDKTGLTHFGKRLFYAKLGLLWNRQMSKLTWLW